MSQPTGPGPGEQWPNPYTQGGQPTGMSTGAKIAIGATAGTIVFFIVSFVFTMSLGILSNDGSLIVLGWLPILVVLAGLVPEKTRWFAVGTLIGLAVALILFAGVCALFFVAMSNAEYG